MGAIARKFIMNSWEKIALSDAEIKAAQSPVTGVTGERNLAYMGDGAPAHLLDVYYPANAKGLLPTVIDVHGGGWVYGSKELNEYYCLSLAKQGFAVININYTLTPAARLDAQVRELYAVLKWVDKNGDKHRVDRNNVFLTGDSSGGHMAALASVIDRTPRLQQLYGVKKAPVDIAAVGVSCGMFDMSAMFGSKMLFHEMGRMLFGPRPRKSPYYGNVSIGEIVERDNCSPMFIITSEGDKGLHSQSVEFAELLAEREAAHSVFDVTGEGAESFEHVYNVMYWMTDTAVKANTAMLDYFRARIR